MAEAPGADAPARSGAGAVTEDRLLDGRLLVRQPRKGHRAGTDAILLAAAAGAAGHRIVDCGSGVGTAGIAVALRNRYAQLVLVENDAATADLARQNLALNAVAERGRVAEADVTNAGARRAAGLLDGEASLVLTNPPWFSAGRVRVSPDGGRARAHVMPDGHGAVDALEAWLRGALALLAPHGRFAMIHRPEALAAILAALEHRAGSVRILPVYPQEDAMASRVLIAAVKGSRAPATLHRGLVLHDAAGAFTPWAEAIHRGQEQLAL